MFKNNLLFTTPIDNYYNRDLDKNASYAFANQAPLAHRNFDEEAFTNLKPEIDFLFSQTNQASEAKEGLNKADYAFLESSKDAALFYANARECYSSPSFFPRWFAESGASNYLNSFTQYENYNYLKQNKNINYPQKAKVDAKYSGTENNYNLNRNSQKSLQNSLTEAHPKSLEFSGKKASFDSLAMSFSDKSTADEISFCLATKNLNINQMQDPAINIFSKSQTRKNNNNNNSNAPNHHNQINNHINYNNTKHYLELYQITNLKDFDSNHENCNDNEIKKTYLENLNFNNFNNLCELKNVGRNLDVNNLNQAQNSACFLKAKEAEIIEDQFHKKNNPRKIQINIINDYFTSKKLANEVDNNNKNFENKNNINNKISKDIKINVGANYSKDQLSKSELDTQLLIHSPANSNKIKSVNKLNKINNVNNSLIASSAYYKNKCANEVSNFCVDCTNSSEHKLVSGRKISEHSDEILMNSVYSFSSERCDNSTFDKEINSISEDVLCKYSKEKVKITEIFKINWKKCIDIYKKFSLNSYKEMLLHPKETKTTEANQGKTKSTKGNLAKKNKKNKNKNKAKNPKLSQNASDAIKNPSSLSKKKSSDSISNAASAFISADSSAQNPQMPGDNNDSAKPELESKISHNSKVSSRIDALSGDLSYAAECTQTRLINEKPFLINDTKNNYNKNFNSDLENFDTEETNSNCNNNKNTKNNEKQLNSLDYSNSHNNNLNNACSNKINKKKKNKKNKIPENPNYLRGLSNINTNYNNFSKCNHPIIENRNHFQFNCMNFNSNNNSLFSNNMQMNGFEVAQNYANSVNQPGNYYNYSSKFNFAPNSFLQNEFNNKFSNNEVNNFNPNFVCKERKPYGF